MPRTPGQHLLYDNQFQRPVNAVDRFPDGTSLPEKVRLVVYWTPRLRSGRARSPSPDPLRFTLTRACLSLRPSPPGRPSAGGLEYVGGWYQDPGGQPSRRPSTAPVLEYATRLVHQDNSGMSTIRQSTTSVFKYFRCWVHWYQGNSS